MTLDYDTVFQVLASGQADELHRRLDAELDDDPSAEACHHVAHWRAHALLRQGRLEDAVTFLRDRRADFLCRSAAHAEAAEVLDLLGRNEEARVELEAAPLDAEEDRFPQLVADARFRLLIIKARGGSVPTKQELDAFPDDFGTVVLPGRPFAKADLLALIEQWRPRLDQRM